MGCAAALGYVVGQAHDFTPAPMALAMSAAGWGAFAAYRLIVKGAQHPV
jgi:hypothetical protein